MMPVPARPAIPTGSRQAPAAAAGFTMVELAITLLIAVILVTMAAPSFQSLIVSTEVRTAASDLYITLAKARSEAIRRNANVTVTATSSDWKQGWQMTDSSGNVLDSHSSLGSGIAVSSGSVTSLTYQSSGRLQGAGAPSFSFSSASGVDGVTPRCLSVDLGGRPSVKAASC